MDSKEEYYDFDSDSDSDSDYEIPIQPEHIYQQIYKTLRVKHNISDKDFNKDEFIKCLRTNSEDTTHPTKISRSLLINKIITKFSNIKKEWILPVLKAIEPEEQVCSNKDNDNECTIYKQTKCCSSGILCDKKHVYTDINSTQLAIILDTIMGRLTLQLRMIDDMGKSMNQQLKIMKRLMYRIDCYTDVLSDAGIPIPKIRLTRKRSKFRTKGTSSRKVDLGYCEDEWEYSSDF